MCEHRPWEPSDRRDGALVNDVLAAGNRGGALGREEGDQLGNLGQPGRTVQRDAAEGLYQLLARPLPVGARGSTSRSISAVAAVVSVKPGATLTTRTPCGPTSFEAPCCRC